jgi:hypothetical protein
VGPKKHIKPQAAMEQLGAQSLSNPGSPDMVQEERILRREVMQRKYGEAMNVCAKTKSCEAKIRALQTETSELREALEECIDKLNQRAADRAPSHAAADLAPVCNTVSAPVPAPVSGHASGPAPAAATKLGGKQAFLPTPPVLDLLMFLDNSGRKEGTPHSPYAFVTWCERHGKWKAAVNLKGPNAKTVSKMFASDKVAAMHVTEQALRVGYLHPTPPTPTPMSPFDVQHWVRCLLATFFFRLSWSYSIDELVLWLPFQLSNPGLYGPLSARQLELIYPGHSDDGAFLRCSAQSLHNLGLPSRTVPFEQYCAERHGSSLGPVGCNVCGVVVADCNNFKNSRHVATTAHVANMENALAQEGGFSAAKVTGKLRRLINWIAYMSVSCHVLPF